MDAMTSIDNWSTFGEQVRLGNKLTRCVRQAIAEDIFHIPAQELSRRMADEDFADDPFGKALQQLKAQNRGRRTGQPIKRQHQGQQRRVDGTLNCSRCNRNGHLAADCYAKTAKDGTKLSLNGQGGPAPKKQ